MQITEAQVSWFGMTFGLTGFMLYMVFIVVQLARESKAGTFGTLMLLLVLCLGILGFAMKGLLHWLLTP